MKAADKPFLILLFLISACIPMVINAGPLRLTPIRLFLLVTFVPLFFGWISGKYGGVKKADVLVALYCVWMSLALIANHGSSRLEFVGISVVEALGPYLVARASIRSPEGFRTFIKYFFVILLIMTPIATIEAVTNRLIVNDIMRVVGTFPNAPLDPRWGLQRVQGTFEHPILYGVFCSAGFGLLWHGLGPKEGKGKGMIGGAVAAVTTFFSLSMGAWVSLMMQFMLIGWDWITRVQFRRWRTLLILTIAAYVVVDIISNRTPFHVFIDYLTFSQGNAYNRILIFRYGMQNVWAHPVFGLGLNDWVRAFWMSGSMDNFWLVQAVRYGIPAFLLLTGAFVTVAYRIGMLEIPDPECARFRKGLLVALGGVALAICTVHLWNASFCFLMFLLGSGVWMLDMGWKTGFRLSQVDEAPVSRRSGGTAPLQPAGGMAASVATGAVTAGANAAGGAPAGRVEKTGVLATRGRGAGGMAAGAQGGRRGGGAAVSEPPEAPPPAEPTTVGGMPSRRRAGRGGASAAVPATRTPPKPAERAEAPKPKQSPPARPAASASTGPVRPSIGGRAARPGENDSGPQRPERAFRETPPKRR